MRYGIILPHGMCALCERHGTEMPSSFLQQLSVRNVSCDIGIAQASWFSVQWNRSHSEAQLAVQSLVCAFIASGDYLFINPESSGCFISVVISSGRCGPGFIRCSISACRAKPLCPWKCAHSVLLVSKVSYLKGFWTLVRLSLLTVWRAKRKFRLPRSWFQSHGIPVLSQLISRLAEWGDFPLFSDAFKFSPFYVTPADAPP